MKIKDNIRFIPIFIISSLLLGVLILTSTLVYQDDLRPHSQESMLPVQIYKKIIQHELAQKIKEPFQTTGTLKAVILNTITSLERKKLGENNSIFIGFQNAEGLTILGNQKEPFSIGTEILKEALSLALQGEEGRIIIPASVDSAKEIIVTYSPLPEYNVGVILMQSTQHVGQLFLNSIWLQFGISSLLALIAFSYYLKSVMLVQHSKQSSNRLEAIINNTSAIVYIISETGEFLYVNAAFLKRINLTAEQVYNKNIFDILHFTDIDSSHQTHLDVIEKGLSIEMEEQIRFVKKNRTFLSAKFPVRNQASQSNDCAVIATDITLRKQMEEELQINFHIQRISGELLNLSYNSQNYKTILEEALGSILSIPYFNFKHSGCIVTIAPETDHIEISAGVNMPQHEIENMEEIAIAILDRQLKKDMPLTIFAAFMEQQREPEKKNPYIYIPIIVNHDLIGVFFIHLVENRKSESFELHFYDAISNALAQLILRTRSHSLLQKHQEELEQKIVERTRDLQNSEENYRSLFEKIKDGVVVIHDDRISMANPSMTLISEYSEKELLGMSFAKLFAPMTIDNNKGSLDINDFDIFKPNEVQIRCKGGALKDIRFSVRTSTVRGVSSLICVLSDITSQKEMEKKRAAYIAGLVDAKEKADHANMEKSEFLANISHELRTPMHGVLGFAEKGVNKAHRMSIEKIQSYFSQIHISGSRLLKLLNDLLDLSKMEAGKMEFNKKDFDFLQTVSDVVKEFQIIMLEKEITIEVQHGIDYFWVNCDEDRIRQVIRNLLSNAIKFSPQGGHLSLVTEEHIEDSLEKPYLKLGFLDEGVGIPENEVQSVFDKFIQSARTKTGSGGTGLGLSICAQIIIGHHGKIWAENREHKGAAFYFTLPAGLETQRDVNQMLNKKGFINKEEIIHSLEEKGSHL